MGSKCILEAFEQQTKPGTTRYYWLDIFVMNQHSTDELGNLVDNLQAAVRSPGRLLLAVDSWRDPTPLTRVWCLLEVFTAIQQRAEVILCFSAKSAQSTNLYWSVSLWQTEHWQLSI